MPPSVSVWGKEGKRRGEGRGGEGGEEREEKKGEDEGGEEEGRGRRGEEGKWYNKLSVHLFQLTSLFHAACGTPHLHQTPHRHTVSH